MDVTVGCVCRILSIGQKEQIKLCEITRPTKTKYGYCTDRPDRNMDIDPTEQTKIATGQTEGSTQLFSRPLGWVAPDPPCPRPRLVWPMPVLGRRLHPGFEPLGYECIQVYFLGRNI